MEIKGAQFGMRIEEREDGEPGHLMCLLSEDDESWFEMGNPFSCWWIGDLIAVLEQVKKGCSDACYKKPDGD